MPFATEELASQAAKNLIKDLPPNTAWRSTTGEATPGKQNWMSYVISADDTILFQLNGDGCHCSMIGPIQIFHPDYETKQDAKEAFKAQLANHEHQLKILQQYVDKAKAIMQQT